MDPSSSSARVRPVASSCPARPAGAPRRRTGSSAQNPRPASPPVTRPPPALLARPAPAAAALVGLTLLDEARAVCGRLDAPEDAEALHDFRVALRRLRTVLRSFRPELGDAVAKKLQRRLRDVTRATSAGRDAEVQLAWVRSHRPEPGRRSGPGLPWLLTRLEDRQNRAYVDIRPEIPPEFRQIERRVRRGLNATLLDASQAEPSFAAATSRLIREHVAALDQELDRKSVV